MGDFLKLNITRWEVKFFLHVVQALLRIDLDPELE